MPKARRRGLVWKLTLFLVLASLPLALLAATAESGDSVFATVARLDAQLFDAFNQCDLDAFGSMLADDLEFYHDQSGLSRGREDTVEAIRENICGKTRRELVPGSLEAYGLADWGAVEIGVHRFFPAGEMNNEPFGEAKFIHLWRRVGDQWELVRVISFDHHPLDETKGESKE